MANNIVSRDLLVLGEVHWPLTLKDYAAKLDRLVDAVAYELKANEVHIYKDGRRKIEYRSMGQYELAAALDAIKLPEQNEQ